MVRWMKVMVVVVMAATLAGIQEARADYQADAEVVAQIARAQVNRTRRAFAVGPHAGGFVGTTLDPSEMLGGVTFGLGIYTFDMPTILDVQENVKRQVEQRVRAAVKEALATGQPFDERQLIRDVIEGLKRELSDGDVSTKTLEKPSSGLVVEGMAVLAPGDGGWGVRATVSKGISKISLGFGAGYLRFAGSNILLAGPELSLRLTPTGTVRTPVIDLFLRGEWASSDAFGFTSVVGGRLLFDLL